MYGNEALRTFITQNALSFQDNIVRIPWEEKKIPKGSKLIKAFKHFAQGQALEDIQNRASQIIQENCVTGTLCFSVHPLDYLSSSENTYNWRSCHALDGEYRAGNLSYMCDKSTIICYLRGAENVKLPMFPEDVPWNNKKWRVLFHISDDWDLIFAGRQYPFSSREGIDNARKWLLATLHKEPWTYCDWTDPVVAEVPDSYGHTYDLNSDYIMIRGQLLELPGLVIDCPNPLHFNDILRSSCYKPHYTAYNNRPWFKENVSKVHVGAECKCLRCGQAPIRITESFMCDDCDIQYGEFNQDIYTTCDCCGRRIFIEDAIDVENEEICEECLRNECFYCEECEEPHFNDSKVYIEEEDIYVCSRCAENREDD